MTDRAAEELGAIIATKDQRIADLEDKLQRAIKCAKSNIEAHAERWGRAERQCTKQDEQLDLAVALADVCEPVLRLPASPKASKCLVELRLKRDAFRAARGEHD